MKLWRYNRIDGEYELTPEQIARGFWRWMNGGTPTKPLYMLVALYLTANESDGGLESTFDQGPDFDAVCDAVRAAWPAATGALSAAKNAAKYAAKSVALRFHRYNSAMEIDMEPTYDLIHDATGTVEIKNATPTEIAIAYLQYDQAQYEIREVGSPYCGDPRGVYVLWFKPLNRPWIETGRRCYVNTALSAEDQLAEAEGFILDNVFAFLRRNEAPDFSVRVHGEVDNADADE